MQIVNSLKAQDMTRIGFIHVSISFLLLFNACSQNPDEGDHRERFAIIAHGGAGSFERMNNAERDSALSVLKSALDKGYAVLERGGSGLDAVTEVIVILEDHPYFNAGRGSAIASTGLCEMDASIMEGNTLNAGAVAGVQRVKNPILAAKMVMQHSPHVMFAGVGADQFAEESGLIMKDQDYFINSLTKRKTDNEHFGTVGCVVLDKKGNIYAGTSTGGTRDKKHGRIGDSPIIGAGTYANNKTCGVSCTGKGEYFIRLSIAHDISAIIEYNQLPIQKAVDLVIHEKLENIEGYGGVITLDGSGNIGISFNTKGMMRGYRKSNGEEFYGIY